MPRRRSCSCPGASSRARGPAPEAIARCDVLAGRPRPSAGRLSLLGGRAVLMAMLGRYDEARGDMARARAGFADLRLDLMAAYLALLVALAETLVGRSGRGGARRARRRAMVGGPGDRWYQSMINVDLAHAIIAQGRDADAVAAVARIDPVPAPSTAPSANNDPARELDVEPAVECPGDGPPSVAGNHESRQHDTEQGEQ